MGFYLRKSINVGPLRFNLSGSGIGVSTGIKGFRIGTGPRGNYVHMGCGGIYFRQTLPTPGTRPLPPRIPEAQSSDIQFEEIESGNVSQMVDSSSAALLAEIDSKTKKITIWPWILGLCICVLIGLAAINSPVWVYCIMTPVCIAGLSWAIYADKLRKTIVLFYDLEPHIENAYQRLHDAFALFRSCCGVWHVESRGNVVTTYDWKVHAGASALVKRKSINLHVGSPPYFKCNVAIPVLPAGRQKLYFLPDRILVWDTNGVGAVNFEQLNISFSEGRFIEDGTVPRDARVVDKTWRYMNKKGGPDRRFNNNYEIPVVLYEEVLLTSKSGLRELFQTSKIGTGPQLSSAVQGMAVAISRREEPPSEEAYVKCPCNNCDVFIEFPAHGVGQKVVCPHCGMETTLFRPAGVV